MSDVVRFFEDEIRNEEHGGAKPATLGSAHARLPEVDTSFQDPAGVYETVMALVEKHGAATELRTVLQGARRRARIRGVGMVTMGLVILGLGAKLLLGA